MPSAEISDVDAQARTDAALFARDALRAAGHVMSGNPAGPEEAAYLAVYAILAAAALGQGDAPEPAGKGTR